MVRRCAAEDQFNGDSLCVPLCLFCLRRCFEATEATRCQELPPVSLTGATQNWNPRMDQMKTGWIRLCFVWGRLGISSWAVVVRPFDASSTRETVGGPALQPVEGAAPFQTMPRAGKCYSNPLKSTL